MDIEVPSQCSFSKVQRVYRQIIARCKTPNKNILKKKNRKLLTFKTASAKQYRCKEEENGNRQLLGEIVSF
jgi:hypothetical protein